MLKRVCDKCGKTMDSYGGYAVNTTANTFVGMKEEIIKGDIHADLCPDCFEEFRVWLNLPISVGLK